ncbi:thiamine pyrophosphate-dependent dehydrogenase E1 component subunit alpha [Kineosporia sp. R_H_3]|uniref:thiamine pyrophosphate-dependent dehydrogenase E1 component subunit alpha n=1 Tax=Kineosporia sp. R_H_3 TaxID=1961848 RepID=UPI000B4AF223|nr:thiamine pyrophosphate-dependent dehydrogenase E1 component subunit alpha [Kineosporia sp. R_H_3]
MTELAEAPAASDAGAADPRWAREALLTMYRIRRFEEAVDDLFARGMMHGTMHLSIGQEASATGVCAALAEGDLIASTHRGHGHCIAKGADLLPMMAELLAKDSGYCRGRGGSMHIADVAKGNLGANGIVGGGIPIAVGSALAQKLRGTGAVVVCFFGDGATNEGAFHEAANLAAIWQLPVVLVCENNKYGMSFSTEKSMHVATVAERAAAYGFPGVRVDGNDVEAVFAAATEAVARARSGGGPTLLETMTYRWKGHSKSDKNLYRTREEIEQWRADDPIADFEAKILDAGSLSVEDLEAVRTQARDEVRDAVRRSMQAPDADPRAFLADPAAAVFAAPLGSHVAGAPAVEPHGLGTALDATEESK